MTAKTSVYRLSTANASVSSGLTSVEDADYMNGSADIKWLLDIDDLMNFRLPLNVSLYKSSIIDITLL